LPPEVAELIFSFLSLEDIVYVSIVCKAWNTYFDAKDIWKKISEHYYGQLSDKTVDLTQNFRWKRIFISLKKAHQWAKSFPQTVTSYEVPTSVLSVSKPELSPCGKFILTLTHSVEIKMAAKLVQVKRDPLTTDEKRWILDLSGIATITPAYYQVLSSDGKGKYLLRGYNNCFYLCDSEQFVTSSLAEHSATQLAVKSAGNIITNSYSSISIASFNSRFVVLASASRLFMTRQIEHLIFDLQSSCSHVMPFYKNKQKNSFFPLPVSKMKCRDTLLSTDFGVLGAFASQLVPDKIVFMLRVPDEAKSIGQYVLYPKLAIWTPGEGLNEKDGIEFKHDGETPATNFSEQMIDGHHWLCFDMGPYTRIIDLNDLHVQFRLDHVQLKMWIPKKNMLILASGKKITVFDVQKHRWTSRMSCPNEVRAMTFNKSTRILFVADTQFIHAFHWETAKLTGSMKHPLAQVNRVVETLHLAYDQVLVLNGTIFMKMPAKCEA
jgi:hypothetical protein